MPNGDKAMRLDEGRTLYNDLAERIKNLPSVDDVVAVTDVEPTEEGVKIWLPETPPQAIQVPTYAEFQELEQDVDAKVSDVQVNGTSIVNNGVASIPFAINAGAAGVAKYETWRGVAINSNGYVYLNTPSSAVIKSGTDAYRPLVPSGQHESAFYGLAKAAGDATQSASSNAVGVYTPEAQSAIQTMLGVEQGVTFVETVTGTTPTITGQPNVRYICGEVSLLTITPPSAGTITVIFESGSTPTVLTLPSTVKFPEWVDISTLEANTTYEIIITDGVYGGVMSWAD